MFISLLITDLIIYDKFWLVTLTFHDEIHEDLK